MLAENHFYTGISCLSNYQVVPMESIAVKNSCTEPHRVESIHESSLLSLYTWWKTSQNASYNRSANTWKYDNVKSILKLYFSKYHGEHVQFLSQKHWYTNCTYCTVDNNSKNKKVSMGVIMIGKANTHNHCFHKLCKLQYLIYTMARENKLKVNKHWYDHDYVTVARHCLLHCKYKLYKTFMWLGTSACS